MAKSNESERFHYSTCMEMTDWEYFGFQRTPSGIAGAFAKPSYLKKRCLAFVKKIKKRINEVITGDEVFKEKLLDDIDSLEAKIKAISPKNNNDIDIIADLFRIIAYLLGWDNGEGTFFRTPIYYQTPEQQYESLKKRARLKQGFELSYKKREIIHRLLSEDIPYAQIALILNISESSVKRLKKANHVDEMYHKYLKRK